MPTTERVRIEGLRELGEAMRALSADIALKVSGQATAAGAKIIKTAAVRNVVSSPSVETGSLRDAIITKKVPKGQLAGETAAHIVTIRGRGKPANKKGQKIARAPHAHFVEFGTKTEFGTVRMPAEPFLRPAFDQNKKAAADAIVDKLRARIAKVSGK
jgi:HK97 gp10 family phage protein